MTAEVKEGLSRGRLLKRAGIGAAGLWAAPILTSTASAAKQRIHWCGGDPAYCSTACAGLRACKPPDNGNCGCFPQINTGRCFCGDILDGACDSFADCVRNADCPDGYSCISSCCPTGKCLPHCSSPGETSRVRGSGAGKTLVRT